MLDAAPQEQPKTMKPPQRRWFSTFRPKQLLIDDASHRTSDTKTLDTKPNVNNSIKKAHHPVPVNHRRSFSSVFKTVKTRYSRDRLDKNEPERHIATSLRVVELPVLFKHEDSVIMAQPRTESPPPRLEMPPDLVARDASAGPSTFRTTLEKAVEDINDKYGTPLCTESYAALEEGLQQGLQDARTRRYTVPRPFPFFPSDTFRPRYQLPTFTDVPASKAKSTIGELQELSSTMSNESIPLDTNDARDDRDAEGGGCHLPMLDSSFNMSSELMAPNASQASGQVAIKPSMLAESTQIGNLTVEGSSASLPSKKSMNTNVRDASEQVDAETARSSVTAAEIVANVYTTLESFTNSNLHGNDRPYKAQELPLHTHRRQRSISEQPSYSLRGSDAGSLGRESPLTEAGLEVKRVRAKSTSDNSECPSVVRNPRHPIQANDELASQIETVPSVSDLVRKFRRMGSLTGTFPATSPLEVPKQHPAIRRVSRGKQFEAFRNRFSSDSDSGSMLSSNLGFATDNVHAVTGLTTTYETQTAVDS